MEKIIKYIGLDVHKNSIAIAIAEDDRQRDVNFYGVINNETFTEKMKSLLGYKARGRDVVKRDGMYHLREQVAPYKALFKGEKFDIDPKNTYFLEIKTE